MGQQIITSAKKDKNFRITALTENKKSNKKINGVTVGLNDEKLFKKVDLIIDFTIPKCSDCKHKLGLSRTNKIDAAS